MYFNEKEKKEIGKWILSIAACIILMYLGIRHLSSIINIVGGVFSLVKPLLIGFILALFLNVPTGMIERFLKRKCNITKGARPLSIVLALLLVIGVLVGVSFLVIPELVTAITMLVQIARDGLDQLAHMDTHPVLMQSPLGDYFANNPIDWPMLQTKLETWFLDQKDVFVNQAIQMTSSLTSNLVSLFIGLVFAIYILANKETLKSQVCRLLRAWLPQKVTEPFIHICNVCSGTLRSFIAGQTTEAIILGSLCMIGMTILGIPYAPTIGALVGVTALIPIVGAFIGTVVGAILILTVHPFKAVVFVVFLLILQQIEGNIIYPKVVGSKINLPAMWVLTAVTIGGNLYGPLGMLLGVPATSAAYALIKEATSHREQLKQLH